MRYAWKQNKQRPNNKQGPNKGVGVNSYAVGRGRPMSAFADKEQSLADKAQSLPALRLALHLAPCPRRRTLGVRAPQRRNLFPRPSSLPRASFVSRFFCVLPIVSLLLLAFVLPAHAAAPALVTSYARMTAQLRTDAARSPLVSLVSLGKSATGRRQIWLVRLRDPKADPKQTVRLLVMCRQHGDEPASTEALLHLIQSLASGGDPALRSELAHVTLYIVPMVNPDGADAGTRVSGVGADLNRDWGIFAQPETRALASAASAIRPALIVDAHNWDGYDTYNANCIEIPREMETPSGRAAHALQQQSVRDLALCGYVVHPTAWGDDSNPHLAHRWFVHSHIPSLLVETHSGSPSDRADFERREGMYAALVHSLVRHSDAPWLHQVPNAHETQEAALFAPPAAPADLGRTAALPKRSFRWLWAAGVYAFALWAMSLRQRGLNPPAPPRPCLRVRPAARYSYPQKRVKFSPSRINLACDPQPVVEQVIHPVDQKRHARHNR